ncbi:MAG: fibronectin type III domain-containing protein [Thioalkalivibrio sp.]|nr:fibronectin type III domain-containing protein [Thioalkalivibrio sp.]
MPSPLSRYLLILLCLPMVAGGAPAFDAPPERSTDGGFTLAWEADEPVQLEQASGPDYANARIVYQGRDTSTVVSGLPDGEYRFRLRAAGADQWSDVATITVEHHSLGRAFGFFAVGAVVFLVLIATIVRGSVRH